MKTLDLRRFYSTFYLVLTIGVTWAAMSQDRVNYPSWALVGPHEFGAFHHAVIIGTYTYIIPFALLTLPAGIGMICSGIPPSHDLSCCWYSPSASSAASLLRA
jgi:hypothetical protein